MAFLETFTATTSLGFLVLGFLVGMVHSLEADHLAAISTMTSGRKKRLFLRGAAWGLGHTVTLLALSIAAIAFSLSLSDAGAAALEFLVGVMLVVLGYGVVHRFRKQRLHFHVHQHENSEPHLHVHSHENDVVNHSESVHSHTHRGKMPFKAFAIGLLHGAAGSSGVIILAVSQTGNPWVAIGYVGLIGIGSLFGMALLSAIIGWPVLHAPRIAKHLHTTVQMAIAGVAVIIGTGIMFETAPIAMGLF